MRYPLDGTITTTGEFKEKAQPNTGLKDSLGVRRHVGVDIRANVGMHVLAPGAGVVTASYGDGKASTVVEARIAGKLWRFMHLSKRHVAVGAKIAEGQHIANSGNSGGVVAHLHVDVRNDGTKWDAGLNNYYDFRRIIADANNPTPPKNTGKRIYFTPTGQTATFYPNKGGTFAMKIWDASYNWAVLAQGDRWVEVNSASGGGRGKFYLIDKNGKTIPGRSVR